MHGLVYLEKLRANIKEILQITSPQTGVLIIGYESLTETFSEIFSTYLNSRLHFIASDKNGSLKLPKTNQKLVWVSSCTQANILNAMEHGSFVIGYAKNSD